jgi:predicted SAM-dependent methyltransferase
MSDTLEVGSGPKNRWFPGADGIDLIDFGQKYVGNFLTYKFPKKYKVVVAHHLIEHIPDTIAFFNKLEDVLDIGGTLDIRVPLLPFTQAFQDPTHVKFIPGVEYFSYFTEDSPAGHCYSKPVFKVEYSEHDRAEWEGHFVLKRIK